MKININEMNNEIICNNNSSNLSTSSTDYIVDNMIMMCNYNSNMHILSYHYLSSLDSKYANTLIILSMLTGIIEIINFNAKISESIYLLIGIFNLILGMMFNRYKELKLNTNAQTHYEFHNNFEKIRMKVDMNNNIIQNCAQVQSAGTLTFLSGASTLMVAPAINLNSRLVTDGTNTRINQDLSMLNNNHIFSSSCRLGKNHRGPIQ